MAVVVELGNNQKAWNAEAAAHAEGHGIASRCSGYSQGKLIVACLKAEFK